MREINVNDYLDCLLFDGKILDVVNNAVSYNDLILRFNDITPKGKMFLKVFNHEGYWMFAGVDTEETKFVISCGEHNKAP